MSEPNECPHLIEVHRLWEGEIGALRAGEVRRHLAHCSFCRAELESWDRLSGLLARGDLAQPLTPERQRRLRERLLVECATSLDQTPDAVRRRSAPWVGAGRWRRPAGIALALSALAVVLLLRLFGAPVTPPREPQQARVDSHPVPPQPSMIARAEGPIKRPVVSPRLLSPRHRKHSRLVDRHRRIIPEIRMAAIPLEQPKRWTFRPTLASAPAEKTVTASPGTGIAAPKPIERLVIQVDAPSTAPPVEARTITKLTIIAAGDLRSPGAALTVVRSQKEEDIP